MQHSKTCTCDGETRRKRLMKEMDVSLCDGVIRTSPQLGTLTVLTINNAAFESKELEDVILYCGAQLTTLRLHNLGLVLGDEVQDDVKGEEWTAYGTWVKFLGGLSHIRKPSTVVSSIPARYGDTDAFRNGLNIWTRISMVELRGLLASRVRRDAMDENNLRQKWFVEVDEEQRKRTTQLNEGSDSGHETGCL